MHTPFTRRMLRHAAASLAIPACWSAAAHGQTAPAAAPAAQATPAITLPPGVTRGPSVEGVSEYRLPNGLRVLLFPDPSERSTLVGVTYAVGAMHEGRGEGGMAHLLEHLLFKGTSTMPDFVTELRRRGISGNANTGQDRTHYYGIFPTDTATMDWLIGAEADRMRNARVGKPQLDSEMTVVRNEFEISETRPASVLTNRLNSQAYRLHPYGNSVIGNRADIENVPIERLKQFYDQWYQPDTATVIIAGNFEPEAALRRVVATFGKIPRPTRVLPVSYTREPPQDGEREITIRRDGDKPMLAIGYHAPAATHPDSPALMVLDSVLGSEPSGRLYKALVVPKVANEISTDVDEARDPGLFAFFASAPMGGDLTRIEPALLSQVEGIAAQPVTDQEVASAKQRLANLFDRALRTRVIGVANGLADSIASGDWRLYYWSRDAIARVTTADVNRVARTYLVPGNRTIARFLPTANARPVDADGAPDPQKLLADYKGSAGIAPGEQFDPTGANLTARTRFVTLGPDLKAALLPKRSRGGYAEASMIFRFGDEAALRPYRDTSIVAGQMLMLGTRTLSAEQLAARMDELGARIQVTAGGRAVIASVRAPRETLLPSLRLVADIIRNPRLAAEDIERYRAQAVSSVESERNKPGEIVDTVSHRYFDPYPHGHLESERTADEELAGFRAVTVEGVRKFHRDFYGTSQGEISIVGDFDADATQAELKTLFAGWQSPHRYVKSVTPFREPPKAVRQAFSTPGKANAVITARSAFRAEEGTSDHAALMLIGRVFGGDSISSRLGARIRGKDGLSYYVGAGTIVNEDNPNGTFYMQATAAPQNVSRVETAMREELERLVRDGITARELEDARSGLLTLRRSGRTSDRSIGSDLRQSLYSGRDLMWEERFDDKLRALTLDQVNAVLRRYIIPANVSTFIAGDLGAAGGTAAK